MKVKLEKLKGAITIKGDATLFIRKSVPVPILIIFGLFYFWLATQIGLYSIPFLIPAIAYLLVKDRIYIKVLRHRAEIIYTSLFKPDLRNLIKVEVRGETK